MQSHARSFEDLPAVRSRVPLLLGITGPSGSGKTYSALLLATGMQRVIGGEIFFIDTEARRGLHYADKFKFRHIDFQPPFGPLDYLAAIRHCVSKGAKILVIDSMTHEHNGEGGVMDQIEKDLDGRIERLAAKEPNLSEWELEKKRQAWTQMAHIKPKSQRKKLNTAIVQLGINGVFCYRAADRIKPVPGKEPEKLGWQPETTSPIVHEMAQRFLLQPAGDGRPDVNPTERAEKLLVKNPEQFRGWFNPGMQLNADLGEKMARWAAGDEAPAQRTPAQSPEEARDAILAAIEMAPDANALASLRKKGGPRQYAEAFKAAFAKREQELSDPENFDR